MEPHSFSKLIASVRQELGVLPHNIGHFSTDDRTQKAADRITVYSLSNVLVKLKTKILPT